MRRLSLLPVIFSIFILAGQPGVAEACVNDHKTRVAANGECLVIEVYGEPAQRTALVIFVHGDGYSSKGKPSD